METNILIRKKSGVLQDYDYNKILVAIRKSAIRAGVTLTEEQERDVVSYVENIIFNRSDNVVSVEQMHEHVIAALSHFVPEVGVAYREYHDWAKKEAERIAANESECQSIQFGLKKDNANMDTALVSTKRAKKMEVHEKSAYIKYNLTRDQRQAVEDGYIYVHDMAFRRDTMNCFGRETRFITSEGVRSFYDFQDGQEIIVLTHKGNWKKAVVRSYGYQPMQIVGFKRATGNIKEIRCTSNHRWILKDGTETCSLSVGDKLIKAPNVSDINWDIMTNSEKLLWCLGFGIGDGSVIKDNNIPTMHVRLCKSKIKYASRFEDCGYTVTFPKSLNGDGEVRMLNIHTKQLPFLILSYENIKYFINGFLCADGHKSSNPNNEYCGIQVTGSLNDYLYDLLNVSGYYVTNISNLTNQKTNYGYRTSKTLSYGFHSNQADRTWFVKYIKPAYVNGREKVWCLEVEDDHSFILENGIPTGNCSLFNAQNVLTGGFEMGNIWYNEPKTLDVAFDVIGDIVLSAASQQYGGFTLYQVDEMLAPYAEKSYQSYLKKYLQLTDNTKKAEKMAYDDTITEMKQGFQGWEYKFNTVGSSRGDYPFITTTLGHGTQKWAPELAIASLETRMGGQGKKGFKKPVLFPKIVFLYDKALHGPGKELEKVFEMGVRCSAKTMYPDWLSLSGRGYIASMYQKYGEIVSPMGCRAFLSPWYERGGMHPADENDKPVFKGRFNIGAISLNLPMILAKAKRDCKDFYEVLDYYLQMIREIHLQTYAYLGRMKASFNPLAFCEGGFYKGNLNPDDNIAPCLEPATASFGITAFNELQRLYNGKSLAEEAQAYIERTGLVDSTEVKESYLKECFYDDLGYTYDKDQFGFVSNVKSGFFALDVLQYINQKIEQFKEEDGRLYAIYGTPAESLCGLQIRQFRKEFGIIEGVSDREYVSNSFHCHVSEDITPIEKQDYEGLFWEMANGGKIQYVRYPVNYNFGAIKSLIRRAMEKGFYEGVNLSLAYCDDCGHEELEMDVCPVCGSKNLTKIDRMNGYLAYSRVHGDTRLNAAKMAEIADRKSM